jgi:hypothetical protein
LPCPTPTPRPFRFTWMKPAKTSWREPLSSSSLTAPVGTRPASSKSRKLHGDLAAFALARTEPCRKHLAAPARRHALEQGRRGLRGFSDAACEPSKKLVALPTPQSECETGFKLVLHRGRSYQTQLALPNPAEKI